MVRQILVWGCSILLIICCKDRQHPDYSLGSVTINVSGNQAAKAHFQKGLLLLHSFEYRDARDEFLLAQDTDPSMIMAYWGEAMTFNHSLWGEQEYEEGRAALDKSKTYLDGDKYSEMEKDFIQGAETLYRPETAKEKRDDDYAEFMKNLYEKYAGNHEVAAFYSLALLGSVEEGRDEQIYGKGATIANGILKENPNHPGALHYLIHSYDDPAHAKLALEAAFRYDKVAPDAGHALHMPSHIFVALGMWDEVVLSNERSYQASVTRMEQKDLDNDARGYHAYHWLEYGYLQQGRKEEALNMVWNMKEYATESPSKKGRSHMVYLKGTYLVETNEWESQVSDITVDVSDLNVAIRSQYHFLDGMMAYVKSDTEALDSVIKTIKRDYENESILAKEEGIALCSGLNRETATETNIKESMTMEWQLRGLKAWLEGDEENTEYWLGKSVAMEESLSYSYGPPFIQKPTRELYAEWLLSQSRNTEAIQQFDLSLERAPGRAIALKGLKSARSKLKET